MTACASAQNTVVASPIQAPVDMDLASEPSEPSEQLQRHALIAEAAFKIAEQRGFAPGHELDDWLAGEREVDQHLSATEH